jgi:hypothetical protein
MNLDPYRCSYQSMRYPEQIDIALSTEWAEYRSLTGEPIAQSRCSGLNVRFGNKNTVAVADIWLYARI